MVAKTMPGFSTSLTAILEADDTSIPLKDPSFALNRLAHDEWTTLLIQDTVGYEVVKLINHQGSLAITRGLSGTTPRRFPKGACVSFVPSDELIKAMVCGTDCCENGSDDTFGKQADAPVSLDVEQLPTTITGGLNSLLGEPVGFMLVNGKKVPYYD